MLLQKLTNEKQHIILSGTLVKMLIVGRTIHFLVVCFSADKQTRCNMLIVQP